LRADLVGCELGVAHPGGDPGGDREGGEKRQRADGEIARRPQLRPDPLPARRQGAPRRTSRPKKNSPHAVWAPHCDR
jgi:hypothetical protein